ncbi:MAG: helix-turn-helix domain-containing protein, partial [Burkholderiales bacterium]
LRQAREAAGVRLPALAASLKVTSARIEALEAGRLDLLPDPVFARALAASVCRSLKIDPEPVLKALPRGSVSAPLGKDGAAASPQFKPQPQGSARTGIFSRPLVLGAIALLIGALVLVFLPELGRDRTATNQNSSAAAVSPAATSGAKPAERAPSATASSATTSTAAPLKPLPQAPLQGAAPSAADAAAATAATSSAASPVAAAPAPASAPAEQPAGDTVVFRTQSEAWISVLDAKGTALLRKNVPAGQTVGVSGELPLKVTVGRADVTKVSVRGEPMDLQSIMKGGVARFEVK